jgi:hypothetical protein
MQDKTKRYATLSVIALATLTLLPTTIPAIRFILFGATTGDWLNDWGLIEHGWMAGLCGFGVDVIEGRVGADYPWEDTLPAWVAGVIYAGR